jgi:hypothetical protein
VKNSGINQAAQDILQRLTAMPGVESAAFTRLLPLEGGNFNTLPIIVASRPLDGPSHDSFDRDISDFVLGKSGSIDRLSR